MRSILNNMPLILRILFLTVFLMAFPIYSQAHTTISESSGNIETGKKTKDSKVELYAETVFEYTDNVFRLTDSQISRMEANDIEDNAGGRFQDMDAVSDYIAEPQIGLKYKSNSPLGGKLGLKSWIKYNYYTQNEAKSFPEGGLKLKNTVGDQGALILEGNFISGFFKRNYLSAVDDASNDNNISIGERIYSPAIYDEYEGIIAYEHQIIKDKANTISELDIRPFAGYRSRIYDATFSNRDQDISILGVGINLEFISRVDLEIIYKYEGVSSPGNEELILLDETQSGTDVNGDGAVSKNAPLVTSVDRSSVRHAIEINSLFKLTKDVTLSLGYKGRITSFTSDNALDIDHYDNHAFRQEIKSGVSYNFSKAWSAGIEYYRTDDEDDEDGRYSENSFMFKIRYNFLKF